MNHGEIKAAFEAAGCSVADLSRVGEGVPDLLVARAGQTVLVEVKSKRGELRPKQYQFRQTWRGKMHVVRSVDEALQVVRDLLPHDTG